MMPVQLSKVPKPVLEAFLHLREMDTMTMFDNKGFGGRRGYDVLNLHMARSEWDDSDRITDDVLQEDLNLR